VLPAERFPAVGCQPPPPACIPEPLGGQAPSLGQATSAGQATPEMTSAVDPSRTPPGGVSPGTPSPGSRRILFGIILLSALAHTYQIDSPLFDKHPYRQFDTAAVARNFYDSGMNILYPQVDWRGSGEGYVEMEFQVYTYTTAVLYRIFGPHEWLGRAVSTVCYVLSAILLFLLVRRAFDERAALFAVLFYSILPLTFYHTRTFQPSAMLSLGSIAAVYFFWAWTEDERWWQLGLAWLGVTIAALIKPPSLYLTIPLTYLGIRAFGLRVFARPVLWGFVAAVLVPVFLWYYHAYHLWIDYGNTLGVSGTLAKRGLWSPFDARWLSLGKRLAERLAFSTATPLGLLFLAAGFLSWPGRRSRVFLWWLVGFAVFVLIVPGVHMGHDYYQLPVAFVVMAYMGYGATVLLDRGVFSRRVIAGLVVVMLISSVYHMIPWYEISSGDFERLRFGQHLAELTTPDDRIIIARPRPADEVFPVGVYRHRTPDGDRLYCDPVDFYNADRNGWSLHDFQATPERIERLRLDGARYFATFFPKRIFERVPALEQFLEQRYTPVEVTDRWAIYRLDEPTG
jgi:hypothetical protein